MTTCAGKSKIDATAASARFILVKRCKCCCPPPKQPLFR